MTKVCLCVCVCLPGHRLHNDAIKNDPFISQALGPNAKLERMRAASLRVGGQGLTTTVDDHLLIIGDAAGHIDPLTGEGIHTAMMGGKAAAQTILDMRRTGDFSKQSCKQYERRYAATRTTFLHTHMQPCAASDHACDHAGQAIAMTQKARGRDAGAADRLTG